MHIAQVLDVIDKFEDGIQMRKSHSDPKTYIGLKPAQMLASIQASIQSVSEKSLSDTVPPE